MAFFDRQDAPLKQVRTAPAVFMVRIPSPAVISGGTGIYVIQRMGGKQAA